ncbi:MAG: AbrB/MazE/SpoVT family DNA-binding domain-containing protein [Candidatus Marinimicrobia bacterium]|nr:AbrB/MazE/SpoVT family DNA-binding domain-containing protein [Candidatus Neomarinimicrobiota bacterium]
MHTKIQKWGNSQGLRIPKHLLAEARIEMGDDVEVTVQEGTLVISPLKNVRKRYKLADLIKEIPADYEPEEIDWGKPVGKEVW